RSHLTASYAPLHPPPRATLFPYTTLFRSRRNEEMTDREKDTLVIGGHAFTSRFILGSGKYSFELIKAAVENAGAQIITMALRRADRKSTRLNSSHVSISYAVFCLKKKIQT